MRWPAAPDARGRVLEPDYLAARATQSQGPVEKNPKVSPTLWIGEGIREQADLHTTVLLRCLRKLCVPCLAAGITMRLLQAHQCPTEYRRGDGGIPERASHHKCGRRGQSCAGDPRLSQGGANGQGD